MTYRSDAPPRTLAAIMHQADAERALASTGLARLDLALAVRGPLAAVLDRGPQAGTATGLFRSARAAFGKALVARQRLLELLMPFGDVLPAAGAPPLAPAEAERLLAAGRESLGDALARHAGQVQFQLTVAAPEPVGAGARAGQRHAEAVAAIPSRLAPLLSDLIALPRDDGQALNLAMLLDRARAPALESLLESLDAESPVPLEMRLIGPAPAISFAAVAVERLPARALAQARRALGLSPSDRESDPARAFRARVLALARVPSAGQDMDALRQARDLLLRERAARAALEAAGLSPGEGPPPLPRIRRDPAASVTRGAERCRSAA